MNDFSRTYYVFPKTQDWKHEKNNEWFNYRIKQLRDNQLLEISEIPFGPKYFTKQGKEVDKYGEPIEKYSLIFGNFTNGSYTALK